MLGKQKSNHRNWKKLIGKVKEIQVFIAYQI